MPKPERSRPRKLIFILPIMAVVLVFQTPGAPAQPGFALTIDNIMRGPGLVGYEPSEVRWSGDNRQIGFAWKQASDPIGQPLDTYVVDRDGSGLRKLSDEEARLAPPASGVATRDRKRVVYSSGGDIFLYDFSTGTRRQITDTKETETNPRFTQDERRITFSRGNNLYAMSLDTAAIEQFTDIAGPEPPKTKVESQEFLKTQERALLATVDERAKLREQEEAKTKKEHPRKPFPLAAGQTVVQLDLCPDSKCVVATIAEGDAGSKPETVPSYVNESGYTEDITGRTNVGDLQSRPRLAIIDTASGDVKWVDAGLLDAAGKPRDIAMDPPLWNDQGTKAVFNVRSTDNKDRWILALDTNTGKGRVLFTEHDDAWLDGPGADTLGWLKNGQEIYFESERDGFAHLYSIAFDGGQPRQLTSGKFEVSSVTLSDDGSRFYFTSSEGSPYDHHFDSMSATGGARTRITREAGSHHAALSVDEKWIADVYSFTNKPPELFAAENLSGAAEKKLTSSPAPDFWQYPWTDPPIVQVPARDGVQVPARLYKPVNFPRGGPAIVFVHGAGYLQNVQRGWSTYAPNYLFHHFLMEHGYLVIDLDYRASAGYGRDWRTAIYRHMGGKDLEDQVDAAKWLVSAHGVDPKRIGIYGGSYGGFITLMAMFTTPDVFAAGAALRPVTDWAHYNHGYTSNILNTPQKDADAYKQSSPIYFAQGLKGALLICHGMVDTNVFFQDSVRLVEKLMELHKENWSVAIYPVENHTFVQPSSWADEYKRIFKLFESNLK